MVYYYDGQRIIETRLSGAPNQAYQQMIHGTQYIDELVMVRVKDKGDLYIHQDANWNVIGVTDMGGSLVERYVLSPYGELTVNQETSFGDRDGDGDVDSTDKGMVGTTCTGTVTGACRILDLDFDGDYDSTDATKFDALTQGLAKHPGRLATEVHQPFAHQGLLFEPEVGQYQNRAREYDPGARRFLQPDPFAFRTTRFLALAHYPESMNRFEYVGAGPVSHTDPHGLAYNSGAPSIGSDCSGQEGQGGPCNVKTCFQCGAPSYCWTLFSTTITCKCMFGPSPSQTTWQEICNDGHGSAGPSGCSGGVRPNTDSTPISCPGTLSECPRGYHA